MLQAINSDSASTDAQATICLSPFPQSRLSITMKPLASGKLPHVSPGGMKAVPSIGSRLVTKSRLHAMESLVSLAQTPQRRHSSLGLMNLSQVQNRQWSELGPMALVWPQIGLILSRLRLLF
jgi:hypothetical protein